jgi:dipeptidyl aminopeptidase/acylaminoacyl peptidase
LIRRVHLSDETVKALLGTYEFAPERTLLLYNGPQGLAYVDYATARMGQLYATADDTLVSGPSLLSGYPVELTIRLERDDLRRITALVWEARGQPPAIAHKRMLYRMEDVTYASGEQRIGASLLTPLGPGPGPAVVMIHGSGPVSRGALMPFADILARNGIAVLVPDKRGVGRSTGSWTRATFDDLAADALAGVAFLKQRSEVSPRQIGLEGASLGGWIAPLAAAHSSDVSFVIVEAAPSMTPAQHERLRVERQMRADHLPHDVIVRALAFMDKKSDVGRTGQGWEKLARIMERGRAEGWLDYVNPPSSLDSLVWHHEHVMSYDPLPVLRQVKCPVLALYGELDTIVPAESGQSLENALRGAGNSDVTVKVLPKANHSFFAATTGGPGEESRLRGFVPDYFAERVAWLRARVNTSHNPITTAAVETVRPGLPDPVVAPGLQREPPLW